MLVPQSRRSRHNIRRERVVPKNIRSFTTQLFQIEATCSVFEGRGAVDSSFQIRGHEFKSDSLLGLRLGWRQRNEEIVKRPGRARGTTPPEAAQKQIRTRQHCERRKRMGVCMMCDLGFVVKPVLIIDGKATAHILHRHGIGNMKHIDVAQLRLQSEVKSNRF